MKKILAAWSSSATLGRQLTRTLVQTYGQAHGKAQGLAEDFIELVRNHTGLLQERGHRTYGFLHLTFEEYLAARALLESEMVADPDALDPPARGRPRLARGAAPGGGQRVAARGRTDCSHTCCAPRCRARRMGGSAVLGLRVPAGHRPQRCLAEGLETP